MMIFNSWNSCLYDLLSAGIIGVHTQVHLSDYFVCSASKCASISPENKF